jgi:ubiquitin carboxyl-terminal hydrolase 5/13
VRPQAFKSLVGRGHAEFSSARQQDVADYLQHLLELLARWAAGAHLPKGQGLVPGRCLGAAGVA